MTEVRIENIVVSFQLADSLNLDKIATVFPDARYTPDEVAAVIVHIQEPKSVAMLFSKGNAMITGLRTMNDIQEVQRFLIDKVKTIHTSLHQHMPFSVQ